MPTVAVPLATRDFSAVVQIPSRIIFGALSRSKIVLADSNLNPMFLVGVEKIPTKTSPEGTHGRIGTWPVFHAGYGSFLMNLVSSRSIAIGIYLLLQRRRKYRKVRK